MDTLRPTGAAGGNGADRDERGGLPATTRAAGPGGAGVPAACRVSDALVGLGALGVDVDIRLEPDGRMALILPPAWMSVHVASFHATAEALHERLRKADVEARRRAAEEHVRSGAPAREWEQEQQRIAAEYRRLVGDGVSHREALHRLKAQSGGRLTVTDLEEVVRAQSSRERRGQRAERAERIRRLRGEGATAERIGEREGLTVDQVKACVRRGRVPLAPFGVKAAQRERRERILSLHAQGLLPEAIREQTGFTRNQVMNTIQGVPRGTARPTGS